MTVLVLAYRHAVFLFSQILFPDGFIESAPFKCFQDACQFEVLAGSFDRSDCSLRVRFRRAEEEVLSLLEPQPVRSVNLTMRAETRNPLADFRNDLHKSLQMAAERGYCAVYAAHNDPTGHLQLIRPEAFRQYAMLDQLRGIAVSPADPHEKLYRIGVVLAPDEELQAIVPDIQHWTAIKHAETLEASEEHASASIPASIREFFESVRRKSIVRRFVTAAIKEFQANESYSIDDDTAWIPPALKTKTYDSRTLKAARDTLREISRWSDADRDVLLALLER